MRVADFVERAGGDHQLSIVCVRVGESLVEMMKEECEAAFQPARNMRMRPLPRAPLGKRPNARQIVTVRELFQKKVRERRRRLADGEARMSSPFDKHDVIPALFQRKRDERAGKP